MKTEFLSLAFVSFFLFSCASVKYTDRKALMLISEDEEIKMGENAFSEIISKSKVIKNTPQAEAVRRVGLKLSAASGKNFNWEFVLVEDKQVNAFCLPGGKIVFYSGIMPLLENDDEIATVMSHEIAHAVARHGAERMSQQTLVNAAGNLAALILEGKSQQTKDAFYSAYGFGAAAGILLPYSRKHEFEADYIGLILMKKSGYELNAAVNFWQKMKAMSERSPKTPNFLSTHPSDENRIKNIEKKIAEIR